VERWKALLILFLGEEEALVFNNESENELIFGSILALSCVEE